MLQQSRLSIDTPWDIAFPLVEVDVSLSELQAVELLQLGDCPSISTVVTLLSLFFSLCLCGGQLVANVLEAGQ